MTTFTFQRGETVSIALDAVQGDPATVTAISAAMKPVMAGRSVVDQGAAVAATFSIASRTAAAGNPAGWTLTLSPAISASLSAGTYLADAKLTVGGGITITEPVAIRIVDAVTP